MERDPSTIRRPGEASGCLYLITSLAVRNAPKPFCTFGVFSTDCSVGKCLCHLFQYERRGFSNTSARQGEDVLSKLGIQQQVN